MEQSQPLDVARRPVTLSNEGDGASETVSADIHSWLNDHDVYSRQDSGHAPDAAPRETQHAPRSLGPLLADPDWSGVSRHASLANARLPELQPFSMVYHPDSALQSRAESPDAAETPPPPYDRAGYRSSHQVNAGLEALQSPVLLPPVQLTELYHSQYGSLGLFAVLASAVDGEWADGIISGDGALAVYRNVSRSFIEDAEAIIHVRGTVIRPPTSVMVGFRGASSLRIHRNGQAGERILIDESTTMEVVVNPAESTV